MSHIGDLLPQAAASPPTRREARCETILDVARACFLGDGYAATSMSTIAARLGGSKGTLYNYFPCKAGLFSAVIRRECARQALPLFDRLGEDEVETTLHELARGIVAFIHAETSLTIQRLIAAEASRFPELGQLFYESGPRPVQERLIGLLSRLMDSGLLARADAETAATHFMALVLSNTDRLRLWGGMPALRPADLDRQTRAAVEVFLRAYG